MTTDHRIFTHPEDEDERVYWECSCGAAGSCPAYKADIHSDRHVDYDRGDTRSDISKVAW